MRDCQLVEWVKPDRLGKNAKTGAAVCALANWLPVTRLFLRTARLLKLREKKLVAELVARRPKNHQIKPY
jgi:hypothetical protein